MMKVLIVDDEVLVKIGLRNVIPWEENGFRIVGEAGNGLHALEIARSELPDIVLTDMRMPVMDGIELIERLSAEQPQVKFIILSAYKDFEYVQKAMRLGVTEYVLKLSMDPDDFLRALNRVKKQIEMSRSNPGFSPQLHYIEQRSQYMCAQESHEPDFPLPDFPARVLCCRIPDDGGADFSGQAQVQTAAALERICGAGCGAFTTERGCFGVLLPDAGGLGPEDFMSLKKGMDAGLKTNAALGVSRRFTRPEDMRTAWKDAVRAAGHRFYVGADKPIRAEQTPDYVDISRHPAWCEAERAVITHRLDEACALVRALLTEPSEPMISPKTALSVGNTLLHAIEVSLREQDAAPPEESEENAPPCVSAAELAARIGQMHDRVKQAEEQHFSADILTIVRYVRENYQKHIRLSDVAALVYRNESYVSHLFRKKMDVKFVDYVTQVRVEKAQELLARSPLPIAAIAESVGIEDPAYFCRVFKKATSMSPQNYRRTHSRDRTNETGGTEL